MKQLRELKGTYGSNDISKLVEFTSVVPIELPDDQKYHFKKVGQVIHIYGLEEGICEYNLGSCDIASIKQKRAGTEIYLNLTGIEKVILMSRPYDGDMPAGRRSVCSSMSYSGESRLSGESRSLGEYRSSGESRPCGSIYSSGESRGESRW